MVQIFSGILALAGYRYAYVRNQLDTGDYHRHYGAVLLRGSMIGKQSRKFFTVSNRPLARLTGISRNHYGQKVIKVFCHEETAMEEFECLSDDLRKKQIKAQFFGGIMGPVMGNLGQISYALSATIGGILCLTRNFDIGGLTIFTNYSRQFSRPISELSMQMNTIFAALAGAEKGVRGNGRGAETADPRTRWKSARANRVMARVIKGSGT